MSPERRILIMAGGTGGHIFPGLALAAELKSRGYHVDWLGTHRGLESRLVPEASIPLHFISIEGVRGRGALALLKAPFLILKAIYQASRVIRKISPMLIVGLGGFVAGPGGAAAKLLGRPLLIHEQNAVAGTTNRLLAVIASRVLLGFPGALHRGRVIGNPVRDEILAIEQPDVRLREKITALNILVLGGSRGARAINQLIPGMIARVANDTGRQIGELSLNVCHQTGEALFDETVEDYRQQGIALGGNVYVVPFLENMAEKLAWANLVICRSGALTVAELAAAGVAALLVPFPFAIDDHQTANGRFLVQAGGAKMWPQDELSVEILAQQVLAFMHDPAQLQAMANNARKQALPNATVHFADECEALVSQTMEKQL